MGREYRSAVRISFLWILLSTAPCVAQVRSVTLGIDVNCPTGLAE